MKIKAGIIGGAGYTGGELIRLLNTHPGAEIKFVQSRSASGKMVHEVHPDLFDDCFLTFTGEISTDVDIIFICRGHGESKKLLDSGVLSGHEKIIDLSQDYRLDGSFVYGLPELNRGQIVNSKLVANPGCFATAILLALLPAVKEGRVNSDIHISAITGSTGAGGSMQETTHYSWRTNNVSIYKPFVHQHLAEINRSLLDVDPGSVHNINFIPYRGNMTRGILATIYFESDIKDPEDLYEEYYYSHPFTRVVNTNPDLKQVVNTNKCYLHVQKVNGKVMVVAALDNLIKGASGQAVQNMNLMFGLGETMGLALKPVVY